MYHLPHILHILRTIYIMEAIIMPDKKILEELRLLSEKKEVSTEAALRLILSAVADLFEKVDKLVIQDEEREKMFDSRDENAMKNIDVMNALIKQTRDALQTLETTLVSLKTSFKGDFDALQGEFIKLKDNPFIRFFIWANNNPKKFWALVAVVTVVYLILSSLWYIEEFRLGIFMMLHVPQPIINWMFQPTPTPMKMP